MTNSIAAIKTGSVTLASGIATVTFSEAMTSADYFITLTPNDNINVYADTITSSGFRIASSDLTSTATVYYHAMINN